MVKKSAKTAEKIFHYKIFADEDKLRDAFNDYFVNLPDTNKPFDCPNLRLLSESVGIIFKNRPSWVYYKEDLICTHGAKHDLSRRCRFGGLGKEERGVKYENGKLKFYCPISNIELIVYPSKKERI
jgi:hypothetical protein